MKLSFDEGADVLYVKRTGARLTRGIEAPHDLELIFNLDESEKVSGLEMIGAVHLGADGWKKHPDRRRLVPSDLVEAVDGWFASP